MYQHNRNGTYNSVGITLHYAPPLSSIVLYRDPLKLPISPRARNAGKFRRGESHSQMRCSRARFVIRKFEERPVYQ